MKIVTLQIQLTSIERDALVKIKKEKGFASWRELLLSMLEEK